MTGIAVLGAQYRLTAEERQTLQRVGLPWAWRAGCRARDLMAVYYEEHLEVGGVGVGGIIFPDCPIGIMVLAYVWPVWEPSYRYYVDSLSSSELYSQPMYNFEYITDADYAGLDR